MPTILGKPSNNEHEENSEARFLIGLHVKKSFRTWKRRAGVD